MYRLEFIESVLIEMMIILAVSLQLITRVVAENCSVFILLLEVMFFNRIVISIYSSNWLNMFI